ncbi:endolytic transglycosylase MltG [bacterium]|nr:endolytic transglycosylase MltG [bacterium]
MKKKKGSATKKAILIAFAIFTVIGLVIGMIVYEKVYMPNVKINETTYLYIKTGANLQDVKRALAEKEIIEDTASFGWVAQKKNYHNHVYPGRYKIEKKMSNNALVDLLRSGIQEPIQLTFNNVRTKKELAAKVSTYIEATEEEILALLKNDEVARSYGFNSQTFISMFIPNSYEFYWNTTAEGFIKRMAKEYKNFWNESRVAKAGALGMKQSEVSTLASIVQAEQLMRPDERPKIAGLYLNRLRLGMRLQSDPTLIFAIGDFTIKRVLNKDMEIDSKYNTYKYAGLPPGPINVPEISSIDAVLNAEKHKYLYMCAKADFSAYHNFATNLSQHNVYAREYQRELSRRRINR